MKRLIVGVAVVALVLLAFVRLWPDKPEYRAELIHASGLKTGDEVRVAGIAVGSVKSITLDGAKADVEFTLKPSVKLHQNARAAVKMATLLGQNYFEVIPGTGPAMPRGGVIGTSHTSPAYTISDVVTQSKTTLQGLDMDTLDTAISTLSRELNGDPAVTSAALAGVTSLSRTVAAKDDQIGHLLTSLRQVTDVVHGQQGELDELLTDSDTVFTMISARRETIRQLVTATEHVAASLAKLADDNDTQMHGTLVQFQKILKVLDANAESLDATLKGLGPQARYFANATGNGPWIDVYAPYFLLPDNLFCPIVNAGNCK
ncbi:MAG: hypothetical protein JWQ70_888 [Aeromicrobium sp.]|nr:hypothetical protein [Aeromicrobium sp.]